MMQNIGVIIQARLGSERLPNKVLLPLPTRETVLERIVKTCLQYTDKVILTTPDHAIIAHVNKFLDNAVHWLQARNVHNEIVFAAEKLNLTDVIRITGDCPLLTCQDIVNAVISYRGDYIYHGPDGKDVEIFPLAEFKKFPNDNDEPTKFFRHSGLSLDTQEDYEKICKLLST